jgi:hypothetical protein
LVLLKNTGWGGPVEGLVLKNTRLLGLHAEHVAAAGAASLHPIYEAMA